MGKKMRLALLTSNHLRHKFMAHYLGKYFDLSLVIAEEKGNQKQYEGRNDEESIVLEDHFQKRIDAEKKYFKSATFPRYPEVVNVKRGDVNSDYVVDKIRQHNVEGVAVFGCGILKPIVFESCNGRFINAHQGLSPYYRGSGTNFFPFVNNELQYVGVTMHYIDKGIDTGGIICHGIPVVKENDEMHDIGCKVIKISAQLFVKIFSFLDNGKELNGIPQWDKGKLYKRDDFNYEAVMKARENIEQGIIKKYAIDQKNNTSFGVRIIEIS